MSKATSKARVGLLIFVGVLAITIAIFFIGEKTQLFSSIYFIRVNFKSTEGVKPGNNVTLAGYNVGTVSNIELSGSGDSVRLTLRVEDRIHPFIKSDSRAFIEQEGLVGNKFIKLEIGSEKGKVIENYGFIQGVEPFGLSSILQDAREIIDTTKFISGRLKDILNNINSGQGTLGRLLVDESIYNNLNKITARADTGLSLATTQLAELTTLLTRLTKSVNRVVDRADSTVQNANEITAEAEKFMKRINEGKGTFGALLKERGLYDSLTTLLGSLQNVSIDASNAADQIAKGMYGLRTHWLMGRIFGGPTIDKESPPESSYKMKLHELQQKEKDLNAREEKMKLLERQGKIDQK